MAGCGIIPADAGSTDLALAEIHAARDHPRGRGEHDFNYAVWSPNTGIIPADAGSTGTATVSIGQPAPPAGQGSSPRTRGAPHGSRPEGISQGIIPADAGSTLRRPRSTSRTGDHPRGRGEHDGVVCACGSGLGSSPRTRGAQTTGGSGTKARRIIPADAGSTSGRGCLRLCDRDHPRGRGEHSRGQEVTMDIIGSSPRTRGARMPACRGLRPTGIIPADAGSTAAQSSARAQCADHPRGRGEHRGGRVPPKATLGSSPRTRGAPHNIHVRGT